MPWYGIPQGVTSPPAPLQGSDEEQHEQLGHGKLGPAPGTVILVVIFLLAFVTYYFLNWKMLSFLWKIG